MMNTYNPFKCDFLTETKKAKGMTVEGLCFSIEDCRACIKMGIESDKYRDQISVYQQELNRRKNR